MSPKIHIKINGKPLEVDDGTTVLNAALEAGIYIPHLCYHPDLGAHESCKLCIVELKPEGKVVPSCSLVAEDGMEIEVHSPAADHLRKLALELIFTAHPADCSTCLKYLNCELQSISQYLSVRDGRLHSVAGGVAENENNPLFVRDMKRCIQCGRCIRVCKELRGVNVFGYMHDSWGTHVGVRDKLLLGNAGCRFCGSCVEVCPTGSLRDVDGVFDKSVPWASAVVPCQNTCPAHIDIPRFVRKVAHGEEPEALSVIREKVPFPHSLGLVCSCACEAACRRGKINEPIAVCRLKRYTSVAGENNWKSKRRILPATGKKVAVIGGGPAGLTAAYYLKKQGHDVTIFERSEALGGHMQFGIPEYRLSKDIVRREIEDIVDIGISVRLNEKIANPAALLDKDWDAVLIATGTSIGSVIPLPGHEAEHVYNALELLGKAARKQPLVLGKSAFIIGGGNVAFDVARTLRRLGVESIKLSCLEPRDRMTSTEEEIKEGIEEGVEVLPGKSFVRIVSDNGVASGVETLDVKTFCFDETGRLNLETTTGSNQIHDADMVVFAIGQRAELFDEAAGLTYGKGNVVIQEKGGSFQVKGRKGLFAVGDAVTGTKFIIWSVAAGREAASEMDKFLGGDGCIDETLAELEPCENYLGRIDGFNKLERRHEQTESPGERCKSFEPVSRPLAQSDARAEAERCFQCDLRRSLKKIKFWNAYEASALSPKRGD